MLNFLLDKAGHWLHVEYQDMPTIDLLTFSTQSKTLHILRLYPTLIKLYLERKEKMGNSDSSK